MKNTPIIIIGFGRSGTSIIADILLKSKDLAFISNYNGKYPKIKYVNLLRLFFDNIFFHIPGQKKQLNKVKVFNSFIFRNGEGYKYWNYITGYEFSKGFLNDIKLTSKEKKHIQKKIKELMRFQLKKRIGFKITGPSRLEFLHQLFPDARFIYVKREPLPNISSLMKVGFYQDKKEQLSWNGNNIYSEEELKFVKDNKTNPEYIAALQYYKTFEIHKREIKLLHLENQVLTINYEDFVKNPKYEIKKALDFAGLEMDRRIDKFLHENKIIDRNDKNKIYFSPEKDRKVIWICKNGIKQI